jgi:predicted nucleotidyltransferase
MTNISLDISGKIDPRIVEVFGSVSKILIALNMPYIVVGATARDLVLHHGHGADIYRATDDVDFAIEVPDWNAFNFLKGFLIKQGFSETKEQHRLISPTSTFIDIIPFGEIEDKQATISWPPNGEVVMCTRAFTKPVIIQNG